MAESKAGIICIGEVLIELARANDGRFAVGYAGDTFNTAVYLARAGIPVGFATALGDDRYSDGILALAAAEGVTTDLVLRVPGRLPGLSLVEFNAAGARSSCYWNDAAPARELFELPDWGRVAESLLGAKLVYFYRHHAVALLELRPRSTAGGDRSGPQAGRQDCLRRQFSAARLEGRSCAGADGFHGGAETGGSGAPRLR